MDSRSRMMMDVALQHAEAVFASSCGREEFRRCQVYAGRVWNDGTHVTVIVDRGLCGREGHRTRPDFADLEVWIYDIRGDSVVHLGKAHDERNAGILKEPADEAPPSRAASPNRPN